MVAMVNKQTNKIDARFGKLVHGLTSYKLYIVTVCIGQNNNNNAIEVQGKLKHFYTLDVCMNI